MLMDGTIDATTLTEPYITLAEKKAAGSSSRPPSRYRSGVGSGRCETYSAFNRAVREAVRRINANKRGYLHTHRHYKIRTRSPSHIDDLRESRLLWSTGADPGGRAAAHLRLDEEWDFLETASCATDLVDMNVQKHGYNGLQRARPAAIALRHSPAASARGQAPAVLFWSGFCR